jgi:hypothetical protein
MSVTNQWDKMGDAISDDVVRIFAACGTYDRLPAAIEERFGGAADSVDIHFPRDAPPGLVKELVTDIKRIPHVFKGFDTERHGEG